MFNSHPPSYFLPRSAGLGLEPRYHASEACVLPLDDPADLGTKFLGTLDDPTMIRNYGRNYVRIYFFLLLLIAAFINAVKSLCG